ncbi:MAG: integrase arm-type DNA-binding domain-containing protein [Betaproteobacteria bacterium]|nr:integrase arm-type DNA-binding domain-containing protein [Betaproteobacteria bacterium]
MPFFEKLTALKVARISKPGKYNDGKGLYLYVKESLAKCWVFRYKIEGLEHYMGMGGLGEVSLAQAREKVRQARESLAQGIDPLHARGVATQKKMGKAHQTRESPMRVTEPLQIQQQTEKRNASDKTFDQCAKEYIAKRKAEWKCEKHGKQWEYTLFTYASPYFGRMNVRLITTSHILKALDPIWETKTETATRLRERIERVLAWATTIGYREGDNPARWNRHLQELLPKPEKLKKAQHHPSMPYDQVGDFFGLLEKEKGLAARALELTILSACRTSEVLLAKWKEFDLSRRVWIIPGERMKSGREHRVPLVDATLAVLEKVSGMDTIWLFPGAKEGKPLSNMAMSVLLRRMNQSHVTVHGFRSTFRIWAAEKTQHARELAELALAHSVGTAVEQAYLRSDLFEKRRAIMQDWAEWCTGTQTVLPDERNKST